jgi:hypothetical protein
MKIGVAMLSRSVSPAARPLPLSGDRMTVRGTDARYSLHS